MTALNRFAVVGRMIVMLVVILGLTMGVTGVVASCAGWTPQLHMIDPEIVVDPKFGDCARTGGTIQAAQTQVAILTSICLQRVGDAGVVIDPPEEPVAKDAGVVQLEADAQETDQ